MAEHLIAGILLGLSRAEIRDRFDEIVAFAGLDAFIDNPVKTYSSGMYMRLGFAIAVTVNPDILLIDGGKGQLNAAVAAFRSLGLEPPTLISLRT